MQNESKLIRKIKRGGDRAAADELVSRYYREIYAFVYRQLPHRENALDLTQDIFVSMLRSLDTFEGKRASLRTWLYRIASNRVIDHFRSSAHRRGQLTDPLEDFEPAAEGDFTLELERREQAEEVLKLLERFEPRVQQIVRLKLFAERTFIDVAQILELPESTVKAGYYAAIRKIRARLKEGEHDQAESAASKRRAGV
ncbi:RNA polymerase subunit sigma-70 [Saccharibacillus sp. O23]|uniref:RNA polymerase sigma factor n=1 Tax=Saccharibacillus sp. O23 TaxID=2009338 RepID=UPI000B4E7626|nr:RNA polymerase sigma factor [Saccharibacillus sp. O23]OWR28657.1 RNA polymerase subunit sigma-70 [Saccharibacillus sp. O23]